MSSLNEPNELNEPKFPKTFLVFVEFRFFYHSFSIGVQDLAIGYLKKFLKVFGINTGFEKKNFKLRNKTFVPSLFFV
ncbi:MAG TPA: hypothetical protein DGQ36_05915 [Enterococcus sp.]|nr:hypothetical protein [Enterococcus sp.]